MELTEILEGLSENEQKEVLKILAEYSEKGISQTYNELVYSDYREIPVDIMTFITDREYLGNAWYGADGSLKMYPFWQERLKELFPTNVDTAMNNVIESGARGLGKSEIGITIGLYLMYRVMCLKNPQEHFHLKPTEKIAFAFMNITKYLAEDIGITKFQATVQLSPWFLAHGTITGVNTKVWNPPDYINIIVGSQSSHVIGQPIYFALFDEIDFIKNQDIERQKQIAMDMIDTAIGGMKTRFIYQGKNPTVLVLASSKRSDKSFLEEHMKKKLADEGESKNTLLIDEPVWNVKPASTYSGKRFNVALGNKFLTSEIIPDGSPIEPWVAKGYQILDVPVEFMSEFKNDIDRALCDFAGIAASALSKYISGVRLNECKSENILNPFIKDIIEVGNAPTDTVQYQDFFDLSRVPITLKGRPLFIHLDMSISGDKTGIAGVYIMGKRAGINGERELYYQTAFNVAVKAPKGYQVSFAKNRDFIYWLKAQGFSIRGISSDTYQNATLAQDFISKGFNYSVISVDRTNAQHVCEPYAYFKNVIYEKRIDMYQSDLLTEEILGLERNGSTGKIDHPDSGRYGSKDVADAICGSLWNASQHADEFAFEFGEEIEATISASTAGNEWDKKQIMLDFEEELKKITNDPLADFAEAKTKADTDHFMNFGMGKASPLTTAYLPQGIIVF